MKIQRTQPPVGYRVPIASLLRAVLASNGGERQRQTFEAELASHHGLRHAYALSSGKAALAVILRALGASTGRRKVIIPAYTCYSLPSAIIKAGMIVVPCDLMAGSFDYDFGRLQGLLDSDVAAVVSVHLFGIPSDTARVRTLCRSHGITVVEDAAQAMGGSRDGAALGTLGDVGFFSLGRGKNVTCGSGGVIVTASDALAEQIDRELANVPPASFGDGMSAAVTLALMSIFIRPSLYWLPSGLPFLRLGETIFHDDFSIRRLASVQASLISKWVESLERLAAVRREHVRYYEQHLSLPSVARDHGCLRYPLFMDTAEDRHQLLSNVRSQRLGIAAMYPDTVGGIRQLQGRLSQYRFPQAERVAATLVTLPTHPLLTPGDRSEICALVNLVAARPVISQERRVS